MINTGIVSLVLILASFTYVNQVYNNDGIPLEPTHKCINRSIKTYCTELTKYYGLPNGKCINPEGNLLCRSGWEEIIIKEPKAKVQLNKQEICPKRPNPCKEI